MSGSLQTTYSGDGILGYVTRLGAIAGLAMGADMGNPDSCDIPLDDPLATGTYAGLKRVYVREFACSEPMIFAGYAGDRNVARGTAADDSLRTGVMRRWTPTLIDINTVLGFRILHGVAANRPAETVSDRLTWLLASSFVDGLLFDNGEVVYPASQMSAADYRGQKAGDVLRDCAEASPDGYHFFVYWDSSATPGEEPSLYFHNVTYTGFASTLTLSNVLADKTSTCFMVNDDAVLNRDPSEVWSGVVVNWSGGEFYRHHPATEALFGIRETSVDKPNIKTLARAQDYATRFLDDHATEYDKITCRVKLPAASVNLLIAGHRIQVKFSHFPGYTSLTWVRITHKVTAQDETDDSQYNVTLTLENPRATSGTGQGTPDNTRTWPTNLPPFSQECNGFVQGFSTADSGSTTFTFPADVTIGNTVTVLYGHDPTAAWTPPTGWTDHTGRVTIPFSIHLGGPAAMVAVSKVIDANDLTDPVSHVYNPLKVYFPTQPWGAAGGTGVVAIEHRGDPTTASAATATGASANIAVGAPASGDFGLLFMCTIGTVIIGSTVSGYTEAGDFDNAGPEPWGGYTEGAPGAGNLTIGGATEWGAIALGFSAGCTTPQCNQPVPREQVGTGDGATTLFTTTFPYAPLSLNVDVDGVAQTVTETDPSAGTFTFAAAPGAGDKVYAAYQGNCDV